MNLWAQIVVWLNTVANGLGWFLLAPISVMPGWLSATLVAAATGVLMLVVFKYTSNQRAIKRTRDDINANLLALRLFKDSALVALKAQGRVFANALWLMVLALVPMAVMMAPVTLVLGQLSLWYQQRPLRVGEETVVTVKLNGEIGSPLPEVQLQPNKALEVTLGPLRVPSKREVCWSVTACEPGYHRLAFDLGGQTYEKDLTIGDGFMRVSVLRPSWNWSDALLYPWEKPFAPDSAVQSIEIAYPQRDSRTSGSDSWVIYWFIASMVAALCFKRALNVNI